MEVASTIRTTEFAACFVYASCVVVAEVANIAKAMNDAKTSWSGISERYEYIVSLHANC
jgi:hypothetical protein